MIDRTRTALALGTLIIARAKAVHAGKTQAVCRCEEVLCAVAQGTVASLSQAPK